MLTNTLIREATTPWGAPVKMYYRVGKNDWNTIQAALCQDEYVLTKIPFNKGVGIDIGGHIGTVTVAMASQGMKVYTVEALPENVEMIEENLKLNGLTGKVYHRAIGANDTDIISIYYGDPSNETGVVHEFVGCATGTGGQGGAKVDVKTICLDTLFAENKITHCDVLKIDCEGGEWPAFKNVSKKTLQKIDWILAEIHATGQPDEHCAADFVALCHGLFENVTSTYIPSATEGLFHLVLRKK